MQKQIHKSLKRQEQVFDERGENEHLEKQLKMKISLPNATETSFKQYYRDVIEKEFDEKAKKGAKQVKEEHLSKLLIK